MNSWAEDKAGVPRKLERGGWLFSLEAVGSIAAGKDKRMARTGEGGDCGSTARGARDLFSSETSPLY